MAESSFDSSLAALEEGAQPRSTSGPVVGSKPADDHPWVAEVRARFGEDVTRTELQSRDEVVVFVRAERAREILEWLKNDERYDLLQDLTAVDYGGGRPLQVVYQLFSLERRRSLRVKVELPLDALEIDSVTHLWAAANWLERETYDMFGVHFNGHPDLRRILMPENYAEGYPLRKDFPLRGRFSRAEQTRRALELDLEDYYTPMELAIGGATRSAGAVTSHGNAPSEDGGAPGEPGPDGGGGTGT